MSKYIWIEFLLPFKLTLNVSLQYLYLRAKNDKERQKWLVALGSAKASVSKTNTHGRSRLSSASPIPVPATSCAQAPCSLQLSNKENDDEERESSKRKTSYDLVKAKRSELRLYSDLLMQQVHTIKTSVNQDFPNQTTRVDLQKLDEGCSLLTQTCDTFISTLDETLKLSLITNLSSSQNGDTKTSPQYGTQPTSFTQNQDKARIRFLIYKFITIQSITSLKTQFYNCFNLPIIFISEQIRTGKFI